jgi:hypothetical protein
VPLIHGHYLPTVGLTDGYLGFRLGKKYYIFRLLSIPLVVLKLILLTGAAGGYTFREKDTPNEFFEIGPRTP